MKQILFIAGFLLAFASTYGQGTPADLPQDKSTTSMTVSPTPSQNYILTYSYRTPLTSHPASMTTGQMSPEILYFDGLGRSVETVSVKGSQSGFDIIDHKVYDAYGNLTNEYLPYTKNGNSGAFVTKNSFITEQNTFLTGLQYDATDVSKGYSVNDYEKSPFNRIVKQGAPGNDWQLIRPVTTTYRTNTSTDNVQTYLYTGDTPTLYTYPAGKLYVTETKDEDNKVVTEYKDMEGRVVQRVMNGAKTRYCYDEFGRLRCVLQPTATTISSLDDHFEYKYDSKGRLTDKKFPIGDWNIYIYDSRDRLVLSQDGNQRIKSTPEWSYIIYDNLNRITEQGTWGTSNLRATLETAINNSLSYMSGQATRTPLKYQFYDKRYIKDFYASDATSMSADTAISNIGRLTGEKTKLLDSETGMTIWLSTAFYYDKFGRILQSSSDNHLGGKDYISNKYNFAGEIIQTRRRHTADGTTTYTDTYFDLDHRGRLMKTRFSINGSGEILMAANNYNEAGNLKIQYLHSASGGTFLQKNDYTYNIRGWLTQMNDPSTFTENDVFGMKLEYNKASTPLFNGNISKFTWGNSLHPSMQYVYTYDGNNRLTNTNYTASSNSYAFDESYTYDNSGNIKTIGRYESGGVQMDRIVFTYQGNRVTGLKDISGDRAGVIDYPGINYSLPYVYDYNGNVTNEPHKQLGIGYNMLNLPYVINWNGLNRKISYFYTFNGEKLRKTAEDNGTVTKVDYCGPFVYETVSGTRSLKYIITLYGRAIKSGSSWVFNYNITDHLGNVRAEITPYIGGAPLLIQSRSYFAFGMEMSQVNSGSTENKYQYNGKELQDDFDLYWYDYGARFYDPALGRWHSVDPLAESYQSYSPYNNTLNNPINNTDPNGMWVETKDGYHTDDPDDILKFFTSLFGIGPGNQPKNEEQARSQASARKALKNVGEGVERLYEAQQEAIALVPGGVLFNKIMDSQTGYESDNNFGAELGFEIASVYLPGVKFAKGPLKSVVKLSDNVVEFTQGKKELAKRVRAYLPEGFKRVAGLSKTEDIFTNGKVFITPDNTSHIGGTWKAAKKIEHLGSKTKRLGTYDENFVRIGN